MSCLTQLQYIVCYKSSRCLFFNKKKIGIKKKHSWTMPNPSVTSGFGLTLISVCRCRTDANDLRKKCQCRTNFFPAFQHSDFPAFTYYLFRYRNAPVSEWDAVMPMPCPAMQIKYSLIGCYHDITPFCCAWFLMTNWHGKTVVWPLCSNTFLLP